MGLSSGPWRFGQAGGGPPSFQWAALQQGSLTWKRFCIQCVQLLGEFNTVHPPPFPESPGPVSSTAGAGWGKGALPDHAQTSGRDSGANRPGEAKSTCPCPVLGAPRARVHPASWPDILKPLRRAPLTVARTLLLSLSCRSMQRVLPGEKPPTPPPQAAGDGVGEGHEPPDTPENSQIELGADAYGCGGSGGLPTFLG